MYVMLKKGGQILKVKLMDIELSDLCGEQRELAEAIGIETYIKLVKTFGGCSIYVGKEDKLKSIIRDKNIKTEFNGSNYKELAKKYDLSERRIRDILDSNYDDLQISIFDKIK